jgi:hypothetical protein
MSDIVIVELPDGRWTAKRRGVVFLIAHSLEELEERLRRLQPTADYPPWPWGAGGYWR